MKNIKPKYMLIPSGVALVTGDKFPDGWFDGAVMMANKFGIRLENAGEGFVIPISVAEHLIVTESIFYLYVDSGEDIAEYDMFIEIDRDWLLEVKGGSMVLAQSLPSVTSQ